MLEIDWTPEAPPLKPGIYYAEIKNSTSKRSSGGALGLNLELVALQHGRALLTYDFVMVEGKGRGIGQKKLQALGVGEGTQLTSAGDLIGRRLYAAVVDHEYNNKKYLKVDIAQGPNCGYWPESTDPPPDGLVEPDGLTAEELEGESTGIDPDDTPF